MSLRIGLVKVLDRGIDGFTWSFTDEADENHWLMAGPGEIEPIGEQIDRLRATPPYVGRYYLHVSLGENSR